MSEFNRPEVLDAAGQESLKSYITKVFSYMGAGLLLTALVSYLCYLSILNGGVMREMLVNGGNAFSLILVLVQLGVVFALQAGLTRFSRGMSLVLFLVYSAITGVTFGVLPLAYGVGTVTTAFLFAAVLFISCAVIGHTTNVDLSKFSGVLFGALIALLLSSLLAIFIPVLRNNLLIGYLGLVIFMAYTAYDIQRIKAFYYQADIQLRQNLAIYGAFQLYLDFINMFLYLIRILSNSRSRD